MRGAIALLNVATALLAMSMLPTSLEAVPQSGFDVTNEQMRGAMLTLVKSYNALENNLERHEIRERALGEVVKKSLQALQKGQRVFEPLRGTFTRLDERIGQMETLLVGRETELKSQREQTGDTLLQITKWMSARDIADAAAQTKRQQQHDELLAAIASATAAAVASNPKRKSGDSSDENDDDDVGKKVDDLAESVKLLRQEVAEMMADRNHADESLRGLIAQSERLVDSKIATSVLVVTKLDEKLNNFYVTGPAASSGGPSAAELQWQTQVSKSLATIEAGLVTLQPLSTLGSEYFATLANETLEAITDMRIEVLTASDKSFAKTATRIKEATATLDESINEAVRTMADTALVVSTSPLPVGGGNGGGGGAGNVAELSERVVQSYSDLRAEIAGLRKLEKIVAETGDNVLAVKRGMEYNVHAVTLQIGDQIRAHAASMEATLQEQFGQMNETIYANHNGALQNLTTKIETEISQVWRQIGIMFSILQTTEMSLNKLQEQSEIYVNGTAERMDGMGGKVSLITDRMAEVDSNLNYLLGRLSLVTQEFNQIKDGLGSALDNIKSSFQIVQQKIQNVGPGPHNIDSDDRDDTDDNQVNDQPQPDGGAPKA